jgi:hypothetical protein
VTPETGSFGGIQANEAFLTESLRAPLIEVSLCDCEACQDHQRRPTSASIKRPRNNPRTVFSRYGWSAGASEPVDLLVPVSRYAPAQPDHQRSAQLSPAVQEFPRQARRQECQGKDGLHIA